MIFDKNYMELIEGEEVIYNQDKYIVGVVEERIMILDAINHNGFVKIPVWEGKVCDNVTLSHKEIVEDYENCFNLRENVL